MSELITVTAAGDIPDFTSAAEEAAFWANHELGPALLASMKGDFVDTMIEKRSIGNPDFPDLVTAHRTLRFSVVTVAGGHGADDYEDDEGEAMTLSAFARDERGRENVVGSVDYNLIREEQVVHVRWVEIESAWRGRGFATALMRHLQQLYSEFAFTTGGYTDNGCAFAQTLGLEISNPSDY
jgi:GNAT superfamily N-acetyltransferase